jgi:hypothetical protein
MLRLRLRLWFSVTLLDRFTRVLSALLCVSQAAVGLSLLAEIVCACSLDCWCLSLPVVGLALLTVTVC